MSSPLFKICVVVAGCAVLAACNSTSSQKAEIDPKYGVPPSPRVIGSGKPIPKGGGREMVGKPYKVGGRWYKPKEDPDYEAVGMASWYGAAFHGRLTANGEVFDANSLTAAHTTMPLPSYARVTNLKNGRSIIVRVNDRGPFHSSRIIDLSHRAADVLAFRNDGVAKVKVQYVGPARLDGKDEDFLLASYQDPASGNKAPARTAPVKSAPERGVLLASKQTKPKRTGARLEQRKHAEPPSSATGALIAYYRDNPRPNRPIPSPGGPPPIASSSKPANPAPVRQEAPRAVASDTSESLPGVAASEPETLPAASQPAAAPAPSQTAPAEQQGDPMAQLVELASAEDTVADQDSKPAAFAEPTQVASLAEPTVADDSDPIASRITAAYATMGASGGGLDTNAIASAAAKSSSASAVQ
ncbi:septal ring lytic transglycosylase RlpA family protein [Amorphus orientalis]|uniref:Endolytic peptidoglycan transglycosylase RlpA n=1 Tax=Amorphus orientalis TaxID=649198 RepID=A0AAE3VPQ5_9HYPH|nr:septal ring lytic transglycosylase RlpA family protein [Amorphus orientalis]MDQ0315871.1 rare lipoprotein A [Amorphus orientalis]